MRRYLLAAWTIAACSGASVAPATRAGNWVFTCPGGEAFAVRFDGDSAHIRHGAFAATLPQIVSASGARYGAAGVTLWNKGDEARLETPADTLGGCRAHAAATPWEASRLQGYDFRAVGQEPGWMVEIDFDRRMHVLADYGEIEFMTGPPQRSRRADSDLFTAAAGGHDVAVVVREAPCQDVMSGEAFPLTLSLQLDGRSLDGCGRWLQ